MKQIIVVRPLCGLCNRMRAIISVIEVAKRLNRNCIVLWLMESGLNARLSDLFEPLPCPVYTVKMGTKTYSLVNNLLRKFCYYVDDYENDVWVGAFTDRWLNLLPPMKPLYICTGENITHQESGFEIFKVKQSLLNINTISVDKDFVGLHIRRTDNVWSKDASPTTLFEDAIKKEIEKNDNVRFYLATDEPDEEKHLRSLFPNRIISYTKRSFSREEKEGIEDAVIDLYNLSRCGLIYGSYWSSFSQTAAQWGGGEINCFSIFVIRTAIMKLLYFTIQIDQKGGLARVVIDKLNWFVGHGYDVTLCDIQAWDAVPAYSLDFRVKRVQGNYVTTPGGIYRRLKGTIGAIKRTREIIAAEKPDVIVNAHAPLVTWILPFVFRGIPKVMEIHQSRQGLQTFNRKYMSPLMGWIHNWAIRWIYGRYDRFVVLTNGDAESWDLRNCQVIPNFCTFDSCKNNPVPIINPRIVIVARLMPQKRIDLMIKVWKMLCAKYPEWRVDVYGEGEERNNLQKLIDDAGIGDSFVLRGTVSDITAELDKASISCLTSEYEGFPLTVLEAMSRGVPNIVFDFIGVNDVIRDGETGYIVPFGDVELYADRLSSLMSSKETRERIRIAAFGTLDIYSKEVVMHKWAELFNVLLAQKF